MAGLIDSSIGFGLQNFLFVDSDETGETYDYVSYLTKKGSILIARFPKDGSQARYFLGTGDYNTIWGARATHTYSLPSSLRFPKA